jgi:uncharacterized protein
MVYHWNDEPGTTQMKPGGVVLSCFPSAGLATTVAGQYIVRNLNLPRTGTFDGPETPSIAVIQRGRVNPPVRVYSREDFALVLSEFPPLEAASGALAREILSGAEKRSARAVVCLEGVIPHPFSEQEPEPGTQEDETLWAACSKPDPRLDQAFRAAHIRPLEEGVLGGVSGGLLVGGLHSPVPVTALLVSARAGVGYPDHRAGAVLIEALDRLLPDLKIDTGPLRTQAEVIERALRSAMQAQEKAALAGPGSSTPPAPIYQ